MTRWQRWLYPNIPARIVEAINDKNLIIVGVIGKSAEADANKMVAFDSILFSRGEDVTPKEGQIEFFYSPDESILMLHFQTTLDAACFDKILDEEIDEECFDDFTTFTEKMRNRFARMLLFATHICHIIVFVELNVTFDASLLTIFKCLKLIRDKHVMKFLPKLLRNTNCGFGKVVRMCSPRMLFLFENFPKGYEKTDEFISKLEFEMEDSIYKMLRTEYIITNNSAHSLFSIPGNKRFVFFNINENLRPDPLKESIKNLEAFLKNDDEYDLEDYLPFPDFGRCIDYSVNDDAVAFNFDTKKDSTERKSNFMALLKDHIKEALSTGFDDSTTKFRGKNRFVIVSFKQWYNWFEMMHRIFIKNPDDVNFEASDPDYRDYLDNFDKILCIDEEFLENCCEIGFEHAFKMYNKPTLTHYDVETHFSMLGEALKLYKSYARGPLFRDYENRLRDVCEQCWRNGKQQCGFESLRGYHCILPKHNAKQLTDHSSGQVFISTCNCGRSQGRREDPFTIKQANYDFYEIMAQNCNLCIISKKMQFSVFEPSISDFRAAELDVSKMDLHRGFESLYSKDINLTDEYADDQLSQPLLTAILNPDDDFFQFMANSKEEEEEEEEISTVSGSCKSSQKSNISNNNNSPIDEFVMQVNKTYEEAEEGFKDLSICRQASTTEYLAGMVHTMTPVGLLPQFPSWSLVCVGQSAIYSHNTGLQEHFQSGFLSGTHFLLPWDAHVRFENMHLSALEKTRYRRMGEVFLLKVFVGFEYECPRGHRFMMSSPDKVLKNGNNITRDSGSKVVYNNMPLYFPCPCRPQNPIVAQLMRVHVVTPKAPVNVILDPKVRTGPCDYLFTMGLESPPKLTQSAYWILRLPYVYQGDDTPILPPTDSVTKENAMNFGCVLGDMFSICEIER